MYEISCSNCSTKWLIYAIHDHRWCLARYYLAQTHVYDYHSCSYQNKTTSNNVATASVNENNPEHGKDNEMLNFWDDENSDVNEHDTIDTTVNNGNEDSTLSKFIACHRNISLQKYTDKIRHFVEFECKFLSSW